MNNIYVDFHTHTVCSDGNYTPEEVIEMAINKGINSLAITDHNYIHENISRLQNKYKDIELINGCEISTSYTTDEGKKIEVHIIALDFDENNENFKNLIVSNHPDKKAYVENIREKLKDNCNIVIPSYDELKILYPTKHIGRMQIADYLVKNNYADDLDEVFDEYIGNYGKRKAFVNALDYCSYADFDLVIRSVIDAGGVPVLAHLFSYGIELSECYSLLRRFCHVCDGKGGLEVYYLKYSDEMIDTLKELAIRYNMFISTASDFHGRGNDALNNKIHEIEKQHVYHIIKTPKKLK